MTDIPCYCLVDSRRLPPGSLNGLIGRYLVVTEGDSFPPDPIEVHFASDSLDEALARVDALNRQSFEQNVPGRTFDRYVTSWHTAIREEDARQLSKTDRTDWERVTVTRGLELNHNDRDFALWSDGCFTRPVSRVPRGGSLSDDSVALIRRLYRADWGRVEGGPLILARVAKVLRAEVIALESARNLKGRHLFEKIHVTWTDGKPGTLYTHTTGQFEGYLYEVFKSLETLENAVKK